MKHVNGLVSAVIANGYCDPVALENLRRKLPFILDGLRKVPHEQRDMIMDSKEVIEFFFNILKGSGDREIQFFALSILLCTPVILKFGDSMAYFWFPSEPVRLEFLKLLQMSQNEKVYHDFVDLLNTGDDALVQSWKCSSVIRENVSPCRSSMSRVNTLLNLNLGTRTISLSHVGRDIRFPFSDVVFHEIGVQNMQGHEMLHLRIETKKSSYSFLGFQDETGASMFIRRGDLSRFLVMKNSSPQASGEEEYFGIEPFHEMSSLQEVTLKHGDPECIKHEPMNDNSCGVGKLKHTDHNKHEPKGSIICGVSTQSVPKKGYKITKSRGVLSKKVGNVREKLRRTTVKKSRMSSRKATEKISVRRSSRHLNSGDSAQQYA